MITESEYLSALKLVIDYQIQESKVPISDLKKFQDTVGERVSICEEVSEEAGFLSYDLNPIGGFGEFMLNKMKQESLKQMSILFQKLENIRKSICTA